MAVRTSRSFAKSAETARRPERFEVDRLLREKKFRIKRRRGRMPAVWDWGGEEFTQEQAEAQLNGFDLDKARALEDRLLEERYK